MGDQFGIGEAVKELQNGNRVRRAGWNGKGMFLFLVAGWDATNVAAIPQDDARERLPFVAMKTADEKVIPWLCSQADLLAVDWELS
jgi:hypothetical protein